MKRYVYRLRNINTGKVYIGDTKGTLFDPEDIISDMFNYNIKSSTAHQDYIRYGQDSIAIDLLLTAPSRLVSKDSILNIVELFQEDYVNNLYQEDMDDIDSNFKVSPLIDYDDIDYDDIDNPVINKLFKEGKNKKLPKITDFM